ncbi:phospho-N-acetylmuramoyl-pentapeptide-transferase [Bacteroidales bacterium OttesenSCG-928-B11]|nr:phospho-N-acetylmuramoyl-pentapeptide-transferase [Bacteroidales bacterium OttesenSCG-928-C03]MDL2311612.1 phospho-N-acetylmuramoyl-pentapeptide-transferase [Bacteroidales bacterium OttesenSCG-928-B11]MDL2326665.1 phospho-N-acetylmuramoyl-pentapeptide-transferase [Bacteroidales bacterium OttesenSCG-928-A14]
MLYYLFDWLATMDFPGARLFQYISFRASLAIIISLFISLIIGKKVINILRKKQIGEDIRDLGLAGQMEKKGTPTMGGLLIIASILVPVLLLTKLHNIYIILMIFTTIWLGILGFADDYIKVYKKNKDGLSGKKKLLGQIILGVIVGVVMAFHPDVVIKEKIDRTEFTTTDQIFTFDNAQKTETAFTNSPAEHSTKTTIPFIKNNEFDYAWLTNWIGDDSGVVGTIVYILIIIFVIAAVSNGANLTDGLDGLATGTSSVIAVGIAVLAYVSGNAIFADYLNIMYIPNISEVVIFTASLIGACIGFYWWNCYPAQIFMGDTGSLTLGGIIAVLCIIIRKELLIPILCGVFVVQSLSVIIQVCYFKYTKKKYGEGKRYLLMAPLHHHYQKKGLHESKIVQRFIVVGIMLAVLTVVTLKVR